MFKNWKVICGIKDTIFMWAIALLDLGSDFGKMVAERFPEYFTDKEQQGPIPWSVLMKIAKGCRHHTPGQEVLSLVVLGAFEDFKIPLLRFSEDTRHGDPVPPEMIVWLDERHRIGDIMDWQGKRLVLVEDSYDYETEYSAIFAPAECIALDR